MSHIHSIRTKRVYDELDSNDGFRVLVDKLWPRGLSKDRGKIDLWLKDIAPSNELRKWFAHDAEKWLEFKERYFRELNNKRELIGLIHKNTKLSTVTLLYGAKDERFNNAAALKEYIEGRVIGFGL